MLRKIPKEYRSHLRSDRSLHSCLLLASRLPVYTYALVGLSVHMGGLGSYGKGFREKKIIYWFFFSKSV